MIQYYQVLADHGVNTHSDIGADGGGGYHHGRGIQYHLGFHFAGDSCPGSIGKCALRKKWSYRDRSSRRSCTIYRWCLD